MSKFVMFCSSRMGHLPNTLSFKCLICDRDLSPGDQYVQLQDNDGQSGKVCHHCCTCLHVSIDSELTCTMHFEDFGKDKNAVTKELK